MPRWAVIALALFLPACAVQFAYNQLDRTLPWFIDDYVDLTGPQYEALQVSARVQLCWHRSTQLPQYADWLRRAEAALQGKLTREALDRLEAEMWSYWRDLMRQVAPDLSGVLVSLNDAQVKELGRRFELKNEEYAALRVQSSPAKQRRHAAREMRKSLERWVGSLTDDQERDVKEWAQSIALIGEHRLAARRAWQARLLAALDGRPDRARLERSLTELLVDPGNTRTPEYQRLWDESLASVKALILQLQPTLTTRQKAHLAKRALGLAADFEELAADSDTPAECRAVAQR
jgi:hypothetical protein